MPLVEIASECLGGILRFVGHMLLDVVVKLMIRGPGYLLCKPFKRDVDPEDGIVVFVGIAFWVIVAACAWLIFQEVSEVAAIDKCLDSGGSFDRQLGKCIAE